MGRAVRSVRSGGVALEKATATVYQALPPASPGGSPWFQGRNRDRAEQAPWPPPTALTAGFAHSVQSPHAWGGFGCPRRGIHPSHNQPGSPH